MTYSARCDHGELWAVCRLCPIWTRWPDPLHVDEEGPGLRDTPARDLHPVRDFALALAAGVVTRVRRPVRGDTPMSKTEHDICLHQMAPRGTTGDQRAPARGFSREGEGMEGVAQPREIDTNGATEFQRHVPRVVALGGKAS